MYTTSKRNTSYLYTLIVALCMLAQPLLGESLQLVRVLEYVPDMKNPTIAATYAPLPHVEVNVKGAGSAITNDEGECVLRFNVMKGGDHLIVRYFIRPGYEVMDVETLNNLVIRRDNEPIVVLMISQENASRLRLNMESQVGLQIKRMREEELKALDRAAADYEKRRQMIIARYEAKLDDIDQYIERLVRIDMTRVTENESRAFEAFQNGNLDEALELLANNDYINQYKETISSLGRMQSAHAKVDSVTHRQEQTQQDLEYYLKAEITLLEIEGSNQSIRKAMNLLEHLLDIDPFGEYQGKEYMQLVIQSRQYHYVDSFLQANLKRSDLSRYDKCRLNVNLGSVLFEKKQFEDAKLVLHDLETDARLLCRERSDEALPYYIMVYAQQMLGRCDMLYGTQAEAVQHYRNMFDAYLRLRVVDAETKFYAGVTYPRLNRAIWRLCEMGEWGLADTIYEAAFPRVELLFGQGSTRERYLTATYKIRRARMLEHMQREDECLTLLNELLPEMERLYKVNRPLCIDSYKQVLRGLVLIYNDRELYAEIQEKAERWFELDEEAKAMVHDQTDTAYEAENEKIYDQMHNIYLTAQSHNPSTP